MLLTYMQACKEDQSTSVLSMKLLVVLHVITVDGIFIMVIPH